MSRLDHVTEAEAVRICARANVRRNAPIIDITDALWEWADKQGFHEDDVTEFAMDMSLVVAR